MATNTPKVPRKPVRPAPTPRRWRITFLRDWREYRGKNLESVAAQMDLTHGQLSKIERGLHPYGQNVLEIAALEFGCTIVDLLTRAPNPDRDGDPAPPRWLAIYKPPVFHKKH